MPSAAAPALAALWTMFFLYSVCGWVIESAYCSIPARRFINRGFLNGPYIPIYGTGSMIAVLLLEKLKGTLTIFVLGGLLGCVLEYVTSYGMERLYHARWWDYSSRPLNLNGRVWAGGFVEFGVGIVAVVRVAQPVMLSLVESVAPLTLVLFALVSAVVFFTDLVVTHVGVAGLKSKMDGLRVETGRRLARLRESLPARPELANIANWDSVINLSLRAQLEATTRRVREARRAVSALPGVSGLPTLPQLPTLDEMAKSFSATLSSQERRLMRAFPNMRPTNWRRALEEHRSSLQKALRGVRR